MQAWTKNGKPTDHPEPWGLPGAFSTLRVFPHGHIPFRTDYLERLLDSAKRIKNEWAPQISEISQRLDDFMANQSSGFSGLVRICLFDEVLGISSRPALSDGKPVDGWLLEYRRPEPAAKCTGEKGLYGRLDELDTASEDWIIIDPKDKSLRESATSNLIFARKNDLLIPEKFILQGIILSKLLPFFKAGFSLTRGSPQEQDVSQFDEILLCGTGRGVAPLSTIPELGWSSRGDEVFQKSRSHYEELIQP